MAYPVFLKSVAKRVPVLGNIMSERDDLRRIVGSLSLGAAAQPSPHQDDIFSAIKPPLPLPEGVSEEDLFQFIKSVRVADAPVLEMQNYATHDFRRFVYTYGLARGVKGKCLELGANPYFTTMLLEKFTDLELSLANYFGGAERGEQRQMVNYVDLADGRAHTREFAYQHFNIEDDSFPWEDNTFDVVIFAEIIEHLLNNPCKVIREIKRVLKKDGTLILTTPNVARLENVAKLVSGVNLYDPYSGYGPYGRHNREYNVHELWTLLRYEGVEVEEHFTADVHENHAVRFAELSKIVPLVSFRKADLGQYIFIRAVNKSAPSRKYPSWLYRSMSPDVIEEIAL